MKRNVYVFSAGTLVLLAAMACTVARAQSGDLAAYARQHKKEKQGAPAPARVYDDDNLPKTGHLSVVGAEPPAAPDAKADSSATPPDADPSKPSADQPSTTAENNPQPAEAGRKGNQAQQGFDEWQARIKQQKDALDLAQRELDVLQREYRLRIAVVASDAGNRLRNPAEWDKEDKKYKEEIAAKQKSVDENKQKLSALEEAARKAGVPTKMRQ